MFRVNLLLACMLILIERRGLPLVTECTSSDGEESGVGNGIHDAGHLLPPAQRWCPYVVAYAAVYQHSARNGTR
jgi:hypothetical protein